MLRRIKDILGSRKAEKRIAVKLPKLKERLKWVRSDMYGIENVPKRILDTKQFMETDILKVQTLNEHWRIRESRLRDVEGNLPIVENYLRMRHAKED